MTGSGVPAVTVIIPAYNAAPYIGETIEHDTSGKSTGGCQVPATLEPGRHVHGGYHSLTQMICGTLRCWLPCWS